MIIHGTDTFINAQGQELVDHGTAFFPLGGYVVDVSKIHVPWQRACIQNFRACWDALDREPVGFEVMARKSLMQLALLLCTHLDIARQKPGIREQRNSQRIKVMLKFIQEHYAETLTVAQIAASALLSESGCMRCFRATIRTTPGQYIREYRLRVAAGMLASTSGKTGDIGAACGFLDAAYFTKVFREQMGCTPGDYRKAHQKGKG